MTVTPDNIRTRYPVFDPLTDEQIQEFLTDSEQIITEETWYDLRDRAIKVYTAHCLLVNYQETLRLTSGIKSLEVGEDATIFEYGSNEWLSCTVYGREFLTLQKQNLGNIGFNII